MQLAGRKLPDRLLHPVADHVPGRDLERDSEYGLRNGLQFEPTRVSDRVLSTILTNRKIRRIAVCVPQRRFPSSWSVDDPDMKSARTAT